MNVSLDFSFTSHICSHPCLAFSADATNPGVADKSLVCTVIRLTISQVDEF